MADPNNKQPLVQFEELNVVGKVVFVAGTVFKLAETALDYTLTTFEKVWDESEKAFQKEMQDDSNDAVIIEESRHEDLNSGLS